MNRLPLEIHPEAEDEYQEAIWWYRERSPDAAESFVHAIRLGLEKIEDSPRRWSIYLSDSRKYKVYGFPYSIVYVIEPGVRCSYPHFSQRTREMGHPA